MTVREFNVARFAVSAAAVLFLAPGGVHGQTSAPATAGSATAKAAAPGKPYTPPRTPDGQPDIQGVYKNVSMFPLEAREPRPAGQVRNPVADVGAGPEHWYEVPMGGTTPMVVDPPNARVPYQPWLRALNTEINTHQGDNPEVKIKREYLDHRVRCLPSGTPRVTTPCAYCGYQIFQGPGYVAIFYEWNHLYQIIRLDNPPPLDPKLKLWQGHARGRWEGNTLVVEVTNMNDKTWVARGAAFHSSEMRVTERYTPIDKDTIMYEARIEDPKVFTQPWTLRFPALARYPAGQELFEYACAEGNAIDETVFGGPTPPGETR